MSLGSPCCGLGARAGQRERGGPRSLWGLFNPSKVCQAHGVATLGPVGWPTASPRGRLPRAPAPGAGAAGLEFLTLQVQSPEPGRPGLASFRGVLAACLILSLALQAGLVTAGPRELPEQRSCA